MDRETLIVLAAILECHRRPIHRWDFEAPEALRRSMRLVDQLLIMLGNRGMPEQRPEPTVALEIVPTPVVLKRKRGRPRKVDN